MDSLAVVFGELLVTAARRGLEVGLEVLDGASADEGGGDTGVAEHPGDGELMQRRPGSGSPIRRRDAPMATRSAPTKSSSDTSRASDTAADTPVGIAAPATPWCMGRR